MKAILARPGANRLNACHAGKRPIPLGSTQLFPLYEFMHHNQTGPMEALWLRWKDRLSIKCISTTKLAEASTSTSIAANEFSEVLSEGVPHLFLRALRLPSGK